MATFEHLPMPVQHGAWSHKKPTFPIFNRKPRVCGCPIPAFCTFSTPVDSIVDKLAVFPANKRSLFQKPTPRNLLEHIKELLVPQLLCHGTCGKDTLVRYNVRDLSARRFPYLHEARSRPIRDENVCTCAPNGEDRICAALYFRPLLR